MAQRKGDRAETPAERLARMAKAARPASERAVTDAGESHVGTGPVQEPAPLPPEPPVVVPMVVTWPVTSHVTGDALEHDPADAAGTPDVDSSVPQSKDGGTPEPVDVAPLVASPDVGGNPVHTTDHVTQHVTSPTAGDNTKHTPEYDAAPGKPYATPAGGMTARVRGRWTPEQRMYLTKLAEEKRATVGEVLRFIIAWYLAHGDYAPHLVSLAPSSEFLVKRETGLKIMDFLTTTDQAAAIKRAAGVGEAAWMRQAVEQFRARGPWSNQGTAS